MAVIKLEGARNTDAEILFNAHIIRKRSRRLITASARLLFTQTSIMEGVFDGMSFYHQSFVFLALLMSTYLSYRLADMPGPCRRFAAVAEVYLV